MGLQGGCVSVIIVGHFPAAAVIAQLDGELMALHLAVLARIGVPHATRTPVVGAIIVPDLDAEAIFLWPWRLEVSGMDADARVDVGYGAQEQGKGVAELHCVENNLYPSYQMSVMSPCCVVNLSATQPIYRESFPAKAAITRFYKTLQSARYTRSMLGSQPTT
jgi:hypothetical protein